MKIPFNEEQLEQLITEADYEGTHVTVKLPSNQPLPREVREVGDFIELETTDGTIHDAELLDMYDAYQYGGEESYIFIDIQ